MSGRSEVAALPSSAALRAFLLDGVAPVGLTDILRAFGRPVRDKARLKAILHDMALSGALLDLPAGRLKTSIGLPETARVRITHIRMDGTPCGIMADDPAAASVLLQTLAPGLPFPLPGDTVLARLRPSCGNRRREHGQNACWPERAKHWPLPVRLTLTARPWTSYGPATRKFLEHSLWPNRASMLCRNRERLYWQPYASCPMAPLLWTSLLRMDMPRKLVCPAS